MDKKAQYDLGRKSIYLIIVIFFLAIMFIYLNATFAKFDFRILKAKEHLSGRVLASEMVTSPLCFAYIDPDTGRAYPGIIDLSRFNDERLHKTCGKYYGNNFAVFLLDNEEAKKLETDFDLTLKSLKIKEIRKKEIVPSTFIKKNVIIKNGNKMERGVLVLGIEEE